MLSLNLTLPNLTFQLWYALAKTLTEQAAWALAMDRMLNMVSINAGIVIGPSVAQHNPCSTMSYLKGMFRTSLWKIHVL